MPDYQNDSPADEPVDGTPDRAEAARAVAVPAEGVPAEAGNPGARADDELHDGELDDGELDDDELDDDELDDDERTVRRLLAGASNPIGDIQRSAAGLEHKHLHEGGADDFVDPADEA